VSYEQAGRYARRQNIPTATRYLAKSLALYQAWGATLKVRRVEAQLREATAQLGGRTLREIAPGVDSNA
jgi:hypothetical protein